MEIGKWMDELSWKMLLFNQGDAQRVQHLMKVHRFAQLIGRREGLDQHTQFLVECAALVHDIGIRPALEKYGRCDGKLQEQEGPAYAQSLLEELGMEAGDVERVCYLVGHHHTYHQIDGLDYQILVEADFLVNFLEGEMGIPAIEKTVEMVFRTSSGRELCQILYGLPSC